ncbi:MAG: NUDIX domain-containing protein [Candidatus Nanopelagicales bacterium]|jgi:8-oxo-dGTP pyrophosphatase MutT (NUDIX family)|nr:NUDIX domain-containing protein [Candidatus Nanopelagicales bacterium]
MRMPEELVARARLLAEGGPWQPPPALPAATVVLLRDGPAGLEALLMRRPDTMAFAPGMHVFPGGRVDPEQDSRAKVRGSVLEGDWADPGLSRAIVTAAVRETFEEAGVLLAVDRSGRPAARDGAWAADRAASERAGGFPEVLARRRLHLDADLLVPIAHWITPEVETRRFDTRFLAAALPANQVVDAHETETDQAHWVTPADALAAYGRGAMAMLPPTVAVLSELGRHRSVGDALAWARSHHVVPLMPRAVLADGDLTWVLVHGVTGAVVGPSGEPAGSEERGTR